MLRHAMLLTLALGLGVVLTGAQPLDYPSAKPSTTWANTDASLAHHVTYTDGSVARAALLRLNPAGFGPSFAFGFFCTNRRRATACTDFLLGVAVVYSNSGGLMTSVTAGIPQVVWSANRGKPVGEGATAEFTAGGDLVLNAANGKVVWSAGTAGRSSSVVAGMSINSDGNLVLFDGSNRPVWQSFDHPTDTLLVGQSLKQGARLTANSSAANWTESRLYLAIAEGSLSAYVDAKPAQRYYHLGFSRGGAAYAYYANGSLTVRLSSSGEELATVAQLPTVGAGTVQYMRLEYDGHLRLYEWQPAGWAPVFDVLRLFPDDCAFPTVCGAYGVCTDDTQCSCPDAASFRPVEFRRPNRGCVPVKKISACGARRNKEHARARLLSLQNTAYFNGPDTSLRAMERVSEDACKKACLDDCACVAARFVYGADARDGSCSLQSEVFSLQTSDPELLHYNSTVHLKLM